MNDRTCSIEGCGKSAKSRGWCQTHYSRWQRTGDPGGAESQLRKRGACAVNNCCGPHYALGWCNLHWRRARDHGDPLWEPPALPTECSAEGCTRKPKSLGLCGMHYHRLQRQIAGSDRQYVRTFLATYGPFPHPCHWCSESIPAYGGVFRLAAVIHHRDHDHSNNDPANLVAAHRRCHGEHHSDFSDEHRAKLRAFQSVYQALPEVRMRNSAAQKQVQKEVQNRPEVKTKVSAAISRRHAADKDPTPCPACGRTCVGKHGLAVHVGYMHKH